MVFEKIKEAIVEKLKVDAELVTMEASLKEDLKADSLDAVEFIMEVEDMFDIEIDDEAAMNIKTVKDIVDYVEAHQ